jgi:hypothetical protein
MYFSKQRRHRFRRLRGLRLRANSVRAADGEDDNGRHRG